MALLTDLPAELRQRIIRLIPGAMPAEVRLDSHGWPDPVNQLLVTCKLLRADTIRVMRTWSFDCFISRGAYIERLPRLIRAIEIEDIRPRSSPLRRDLDPVRGVVTECIARLRGLPRQDIKTVVVDATPLPQDIIENHPQLVDTNLRLFHTSKFLWGNRGDVSDIILQLNQHFNPATLQEGGDGIHLAYADREPRTRLMLAGRFGKEYRLVIRTIMADPGISSISNESDACAFVGTFLDCDMPTNL